MTSYGFASPLDALVFDTVPDTEQSEHDAAEELALWSNAQFTFDVNPGKEANPEDEETKTETIHKLEYPNDVLDPITYEKLVEYLDYELPQQQQQQQQQHHQYTPIAPATQVNGFVPILPASANNRHPTILPKPVALDALPSPAPSAPVKTVRKKKRAAPEERTDDQVAAEEDKRRRNTAASARFRVKKKLREQAMEKHVQDMQAKSDSLQQRVNELELEVKWLRNLLIEKKTSA